MAIITPKLRYSVAQSFVDMFSDSTTQNAYFFIGRSRPWLDPQAHVGTGQIKMETGTNSLTMTSGTGNFQELTPHCSIKNLDTGEIRLMTSMPQTPNYLSCTVNYQATVPWNTRNWAWKEAEMGFLWQDDDNPPQANGSQYNQNETFNQMLALKKINTGSDILGQTISYVIPRHTWDTSHHTQYFPYSDADGDLYDHPTAADIATAQAWNVARPATPYTAGSHFVTVFEGENYYTYKCLSVGYKRAYIPGTLIYESIPCLSTQCPTLIKHDSLSNYTHTYSDGYTWKLMFKPDAGQVLKYLTDSWVPVSSAEEFQLTIQNAAADYQGAIETIRVIRSNSIVRFFGDGTLSTPVAAQKLPAQVGGNYTHLQLPSDASIAANYYVGCDVYTIPDDGNPDRKTIRKIVSYPGSSRILTVDVPWNATTKPQENDFVCIAPRVIIVGKMDTNGREASARAIVNSSGYINSIQMIDPGFQYRIAQAKVTTMVSSSGQLLTDDVPVPGVALKAEVAPILGHGSNAMEELGAYYVMMYLQLKNIEGDLNSDLSRDFMYSNDYRSIGIAINIENPIGNPVRIASANTLKAVKTLKLHINSGDNLIYDNDELIECTYNGEVVARGYVVEHLLVDSPPVSGTLSYVQDFYTGFGEFVVGGTIQGLTSSASHSIHAITGSEIADSLGQIVYIEQRKPINRSSEQLEDIKLVIEF